MPSKKPPPTKKSAKKNTPAKTSKSATSKKTEAEKPRKSGNTTEAASEINVPIPGGPLEPEEKELIEVLQRNPELLQCDLSSKVTMDSRKASRLIINMETKRIIQRERVLNNGRWTYVIRINQELPKVEVKGKKTWETLENCPCFVCPDLDGCAAGQNKNNPQFCLHLTRWMGCCMVHTPFVHGFSRIEDGLKKD